MSVCTLCCAETTSDIELCSYHHRVAEAAAADNWAMTNRAMCDLLHRKKPPPRLPVVQRDDTLVVCAP